MTAGQEASAVARIVAIARRDVSIQLSYPVGIVIRFGQTLLLVATLYFISKLVDRPQMLGRFQGHYFQFALVGVVVVSFVTLGLGAFSQTIAYEQQAGTLEVLLSTPTRFAILLAGAFVVPLGLTAFEIVLAVGLAGALDSGLPVAGMVVALPVLVLTVASFCAFGILSAGFIILTKRGDPIGVIGTQATTFLAGALFPIQVLPGWLQAGAKLVPAYYGLRAMREALLGGAGLAAVGGDLVVLGAFAVVLLPLSVAFFSWTVRVARVTGTLSTY